MTRLVNRHAHKPNPSDVYIGRGTKYGNPYSVDEHGPSAMPMYLRYFISRLVGETEYPARAWISTLWELRGRVLVCSCAPRPCHGDAIVEWIHAVDERLGMQERFGLVSNPTPEAVTSGLTAVAGMLEHALTPVQGSIFAAEQP